MNQQEPILPLVAIVGPTASGKSALGVWLAEQLNGEVVACDSTQLYRGSELGAAGRAGRFAATIGGAPRATASVGA